MNVDDYIQKYKEKGNICILDEPTTGLHVADITKVANGINWHIEIIDIL